MGDRVLIIPFDPKSDDSGELATMESWGGKGAGDVQGTLRQYGVLVSSLQEEAHNE